MSPSDLAIAIVVRVRSLALESDSFGKTWVGTTACSADPQHG